jgi:hypothetical protein
MVWAGHLDKLLKVVDRLPCLILKVMLSGSNVFLIGVVGLPVTVTLIAASGNCELLGVLIWPPLTTFGAPLCAYDDSLRQCSLATGGDPLPITLDENGSDYLLTGGVPGGNVKQLLCCLRLITAEFMH